MKTKPPADPVSPLARYVQIFLCMLFVVGCISLPVNPTRLPTLAIASATPFLPVTVTNSPLPPSPSVTITEAVTDSITGDEISTQAPLLTPSPSATLPAATPTATLPPMTAFQAPNERITILIPAGGRYIIIGDSISYGSTMSGGNTYEDICENRWPYAEQLAVETGILSTASLDRGDSMKTPFYTQILKNGQVANYCEPPPGTPLLSTAVAGSNTVEWLSDLIEYPVLIEALEQYENPVILFLVGADIFAAKIGKPAINVAEYEQNVGKIISILASYQKVIYLAHIPHVALGTFIPQKELASTNATIDEFNRRLTALVEQNGYLDLSSGAWVDFGEQILNQDGLLLYTTTLQFGPHLDELSDAALGDFYAKDGLHFHAEGYNRIGAAWAEALKAPIRINQAEYAP